MSPSMQDKLRRFQLQLFSNAEENIASIEVHPFVFPAHVLNIELKQNNVYHKCEPKSVPGMHLGALPLHNRSIALVFSKETGKVSQ